MSVQKSVRSRSGRTRPDVSDLKRAASDLSGLEDEVLVERYLAGGRRDDAIFKELFRRRRDDVWRTCYSFFGNPQDAEDLTQQIFFTAYRKLPQYRRQASLRTWLHRIAANTCKNELRRRSRRPEGSETELPDDHRLMSGASTAEQELVLRRRKDRLAVAMGELSSAERSLIQLIDFEGRTYAEVADQLGLSIGATKMRVLRARLALKRAYQKPESKGESP